MIAGYFLKNSSVRVIAFGMNVAISFVMTPFITSVMGIESYGGWALISSMQAYLNLLDFGVMSAVSRHGSAAIGGKDPEKLERLLSSAFFLNLVSFLIALVASFCSPAVYRFILSSDGEVLEASPLILFGCLFSVTLLVKSLMGLLMAYLEWTSIALISLGRTILMSVVLYLVLTRESCIMQMAVINGVGIAAEALVMAWFCLKRHAFRPRLKNVGRHEIKEILHYGFSVIFMGFGDTLRYRTQGFIVGRFLGVGEVAFISIALQFISYFTTFMLSAFGIMTPYFARLTTSGTDGDRTEGFRDAFQCCMLSATFIGMSLIMYGDVFISRWLGHSYLGAYDILVPFAFGAMFSLGTMPADALLLGVARHSISSRWNVIEGLCIFIATLIFVPHFGSIASGWAYCVVVIISRTALTFMMVARERNFTSRRMLAKIFLQFFAVCGIQECYYLLVSGLIHSSLLHAAICFLIHLIIMLIILIVMTRRIWARTQTVTAR